MDAISEWMRDMSESKNTSDLIQEYSKMLSINLIDREFGDIVTEGKNPKCCDAMKIAAVIGIGLILAYALMKIALFWWFVYDARKEKPSKKWPTVLMTDGASIDLDPNTTKVNSVPKVTKENRIPTVPGEDGVQSITKQMRVLTVTGEERHPNVTEENRDSTVTGEDRNPEEIMDPASMKEIPKWVRQNGRMRKILNLEGNSHHHY